MIRSGNSDLLTTREAAKQLHMVRSTLLIKMKDHGCHPVRRLVGRAWTFFWTSRQLKRILMEDEC